MMILNWLILFVFCLYTVECSTNWLEKITYQALANSPCVKLLNATNEIGCRSKSISSILYGISSQEELESFKNEKVSGKFAVVITTDLLNVNNLRILEKSKKLAGVIVLYNDAVAHKPYSPDKACPNCEFGMYTGEKANYRWNKYGDGLIYELFDFPIFGSFDSTGSSSLAIKEALTYNKKRNYNKYPLYAVEFESFMFSSQDSDTCLRRGFCDPIGGNSVWSTFSKEIAKDDNKDIIIVTAQLDGNSFFHDFASGANSQMGGLVANLAIAKALSNSPIPISQFNKHIVFTFFSGESYGYSGSQRFVKDINDFTCKTTENNSGTKCSKYAACQDPCMFVDDFKNITLSNIKAIIELNQLTCNGCSDYNNPSFFMHVDDNTDPETLKLVNTLQNTANFLNAENTKTGVNVNLNNTTGAIQSTYSLKPAWDGLQENLGLPPSSSQSFLKMKKIPAVVISDFQTEFTNPYYHSAFDRGYDLNDYSSYSNTICKTANVVAKSLWLYAQGLNDTRINEVPADVYADCNYVDDLMYCLSRNISCPLAVSLLNSNTNSSNYAKGISEFSHYSGVFNQVSLNGIINTNYNYDSWLANFAILTSTGYNTTKPCVTIKDCYETTENTPYSLRSTQCVAGFCIEGRVYSHPAYGTGLEYNVDEDKYYVVDSKLPTWTESKWSENRLRIYFTTSKFFQMIELLIGILFVAGTACGYYIIKRYVHKTLKIA